MTRVCEVFSYIGQAYWFGFMKLLRTQSIRDLIMFVQKHDRTPLSFIPRFCDWELEVRTDGVCQREEVNFILGSPCIFTN